MKMFYMNWAILLAMPFIFCGDIIEPIHFLQQICIGLSVFRILSLG